MYLGIDLGTTVLKVAAFAARDGKRLATASQRLPLVTAADGTREQDPLALRRGLQRAFAAVREELGDRWRRLRGIGLAAQGGSTLIVDRQTGEPRTPLILWNDARSFAAFHQLCAAHKPSYWRSFAQRDEPGMGLARIVWLREKQPEAFAGDALYAGAGEYLYFLLTGQWRQDGCNAQQEGIYDARRHTLTRKPLKSLGVDLSLFAPLREGQVTVPVAEKTAQWLQLPGTVPVAGPYNDHEAGYLSTLGVSARPLECSLGTAWVGNFVVPPGLRGYSPFSLPIAAPQGEGVLEIQPLLTGNVTWDWALETFVAKNHKRALARQAELFRERVLPPAGLVALPWLNRPNALAQEHNGSACLWGLGPATDRHELVRAVALGITLEFARVFAAVRERGAVDSLVLCGGAANGEQFRQLIAALFAPLPVYVVRESDWMGARGCLAAFDAELLQTPVNAVKRTRAIDEHELARAQEQYLEVFERLYGQVGAGAAYAIEKEK